MTQSPSMLVTREEAIRFCENALRNIGSLHLSEEDISDIADALTAFRDKSLRAHTKGLVDALTEARAALHQHYVDWDGEPEDAVPLQLARTKCDEALALHPEASEDLTE